jgi:MFS family permease
VVLNALIVVMLVYARMLGAGLDRSGRLVSGVGGADFLGCFCGPLLGGLFTVSSGDNVRFSVVLAVAFLVAATLALAAGRRITADQRSALAQ